MSKSARVLLALAFSVTTVELVFAHGPVDERIHTLTHAISRDPGNVDLLLERAVLYTDIGRHADALKDYEHASRVDPLRDVILLGRSQVLCAMHEFERALESVDVFLSLHPRDAAAWRVRARCLDHLARTDDAIVSLNRVIELADPPTPDDYVTRARLIASRGDLRVDEAVAGLDEGILRLGPAVSLQMAAVELERARGGHAAAQMRLNELQGVSGTMRTERTPSMHAAARTPATAPAITRGPYLQMGTGTSVVVCWRTDVAATSRAYFGAWPDSLDQVQDDSTLTTEHVVTLSGLSPETRYYYAIGTVDSTMLAGGDANHYFDTSPPAGEDRAFRVWVVGDAGTKGARQAGVRNAYRNHPGADDTDVWLMLGDNAYNDGTDAEYEAAVFDMYPTFLRNTILWSTRGNHDLIHSGSNNDYYEIFTLPTAAEAGGLASGTEAYYSFDYANVHFVCLDSQGSNRSPGGAMLTWLEQDLAATAQEWIIAFWHHPPYSKGSHDSDTELRLVEMRQNALPVLEAAGVDLVLAGHSHSYERSYLLDGHYGLSATLHDSMKVDAGDGRPAGDGAYRKPPSGPQSHNGAVYTVAGTSGSVGGGTYDHPVMVTSLARLGSLVLDIDGATLLATFIDTTGAALDSFVVDKSDAPARVGRTPASRIPLSVRPNPFETSAQIHYTLDASRRVHIAIYNVRGQLVRSLVERTRHAGSHRETWDARDDRGQNVAQGVYFAVLTAGTEQRTARLVLVR